MNETRSLDQIEWDNPGFWLTCRYDREGAEYAIIYRDRQGERRHVHCRSKDQLQVLIDRLRAAHHSG
ncbi:hypothetical protein [Gloeobacter kilaueensis]|uniref:Uncharacterized protein n=1 Tax=Gloeobacter kilaueensis (strain ATCC BAA-2537 / CCAP 1431/1 / ULC 316 / JS1) TaxID=1183438 RepID=U5QKW0_GLOK1|nr:hypothetical protein [Gloeobacter kilaueensis]AGY58295.1 hypothetical protein GKIL_2049 [Gloeobacter kilaueensis JS1]